LKSDFFGKTSTSDLSSNPAENPRPLSAVRIPALDGLRGVAVALILVHHRVELSPMLNAPPGDALSYLRAALVLTPSGVDLFFVLSGFLIGGILFDHRNSPRLLRTFYGRRFLRILPLAWIWIALNLWLFPHSSVASAPGPAWPYFTFTYNFKLAHLNHWGFGPLDSLWSLCIEEQFYLFLPWIVRAWPARRLAWIGPAMIAIAWSARLALVLLAPQRLFASHVLTLFRLDVLGYGVTAAWLARSTAAHWVFSRRSALWIFLGINAVGLTYLVKIHASFLDVTYQLIGYPLVGIFYTLVLLLAYSASADWLGRALRVTPLLALGRYSYFIYLFQATVAVLVIRPLLSRLALPQAIYFWLSEALLLPLLLVGLAWLSWRVVEGPLVRIGHRFRY